MTKIKLIYLITFWTFNLTAYSQTKNDTIWYTSGWQRTTYSKVKTIYGIKDYDETGCGMATYYYKNGTLHSHQNECEDLKHGLCIWYHVDGKKSTEAYYINDTLHGEFRNYDEEEQLNYVSHYKMGKRVERIEYDTETGQPIAIGEGIVDFPEIETEYDGGPEAMQRWIAENVNYPQDAIEMNEQGKVYLSFVIEPNGEISNIVVERSVSEALDNEAIRLIKSMPPWIPGEVKGKKVRVRVRLPINFTLTSDEDDKKKKGKR